MKVARIVLAVLVVAVTLAVVAPTPPAHAAGPTILGAGSTWVQNAIDTWRADASRLGLSVNYQGNGSSSGRQFYISDQVDFAATEIPFQADEIARLGPRATKFNYLPDVAGGTAMMYNLRDSGNNPITNLQLSGPTIAKIFTGAINNWDDPAITADNGGRVLPSRAITPVVRSDGSGTSAQLSLYLHAIAPDVYDPWARSIPQDPALPLSNWLEFPGSVAQAGSDGVANFVNNDQTGIGAITYVEASYAKERNRPVAAVRNASGSYTIPAAGNVAVALRAAKLFPDRTQDLRAVYVNPDPAAYPISSYSYMVVPTTADEISADKGAVLAKFIYFAVCKGQEKMANLGYSPMPENLVTTALDAAKAIPGAPAPPSLANCKTADPATFAGNTGAATTGGSGSSGSGSGSSTGGSGATGTSADGSSGSGAIDPLTGLPYEGDTTNLRAAPATVRLKGGETSSLPLVLAGIGLVLLVMIPPVMAGLRRAKRPPTGGPPTGGPPTGGPPTGGLPTGGTAPTMPPPAPT